MVHDHVPCRVGPDRAGERRPRGRLRAPRRHPRSAPSRRDRRSEHAAVVRRDRDAGGGRRARRAAGCTSSNTRRTLLEPRARGRSALPRVPAATGREGRRSGRCGRSGAPFGRRADRVRHPFERARALLTLGEMQRHASSEQPRRRSSRRCSCSPTSARGSGPKE